MYDRQTDRVGGIIDVPAHLVPQALSVARITNATDPGEVELHERQVRALARLLNFRHNVGRYIYHLETVLGVKDRLYA
jgi:hypothetical protein